MLLSYANIIVLRAYNYQLRIRATPGPGGGEGGRRIKSFFLCLPEAAEADAIKQAMVVQRQRLYPPLVSCGFDLPPGPAGLLAGGIID